MELKSVADFIAAAKDAYIAGKFEEGDQYTKQAEALKKLDSLTPAQPEPQPEAKAAPVRLPLDSPADEPKDEIEPALKAAYVKRYGDLDAGTAQIAKELYDGANYMKLRAAKNADFKRYLRHGVADPQLARLMLLTPDQIIEAYAVGESVKHIKATMIESSDTLGGYVVAEDFRTNIISRLPGLTTVRPLANVITTNSDRVMIPIATGGDNRHASAVRVTWVDEAPTAGASATAWTWGQVGIPIHTVMAKLSLSRNLLEDAAFDLAGYIARQFAIEMALDEDAQFLTGSGAGRPQGVLNGTAASGAPFDSDVTTINSGSGSALTVNGMIAIPYGLAAQYRQNGGVFVFAKDTAKAIRQLADGQQRPLWADNIQQLQAGQPPKLLGYDVRENEAMPAIAANKYPIIFGDFSGYTVADRIGMSVERYMDSSTADTNSVVYYARRRLGGQVTEGYRFVVQKIST